MIIKEGYNSKPLTIKIHRSDSNKRMAEIWIEEEGLDSLGEGHVKERLHYATLDELLDLKDEVEKAIKEVAGL